MKRYQKTKASQYIVVGMIIIGVIAAAIISSIIMRRTPFEDHFAIPWAAGRAWLLESLNPYETEIVNIAENAIQDSPYKAILPEEETLLLPLINLVFYLPFSLIPYTVSRLIWVTLISLSILLVAIISLSLSNWKLSSTGKVLVALMSLLWIPGITTSLMGQLPPILILLLVISIYLFLAGQDTTAGFILALTAGSFNMSGLVIIMILVYGIMKRRWSVVSAFVSGLAFIIFISVLLIPSWPRDWLSILVGNYPNFELLQTPLMALAAYLPGVEGFLSIFLHGLFGIYFLFMVITMKRNSERVIKWNLFASLVIAFLVNIRGSIHFIFLIYPALFVVFRFFSERWGILGRVASWIILTVFIFSSWLLFLPVEAIRTPIELPLIYFGIPILVFIGMNWIRWWAIKIPRLPFETL
jgi:hypothetical protein